MNDLSRRHFINAGAAAAGSLYAGGASAQSQCDVNGIAPSIVLSPQGPGIYDTCQIQRALNSKRDVFLTPGDYLLDDALYMKTVGQALRGQATLMMTVPGKPCVYLGATNAAGDPMNGTIAGARISGLVFINNAGSRDAGSAGIAFVKATTTQIDSILVRGFHAGIDVRNISLANTIINADLRGNTYGFHDPSTNPFVSDFQGSQFFGGRVEQNSQEGVLLGSPNVKFFGTVIEGNGLIADGGDGTRPEVTIAGGSGGGAVHFVDCYMETVGEKSVAGMIQIAAGANRRVFIMGGEYYAGGASNRYIVDSLSASTSQGVYIIGGQFAQFKNYVRATLQNNCAAVVSDVWSDAARDLFADVTASAGALIQQTDRVHGLRSNGAARFPQVYETSDTDAGSQFGARKRSFRVAQSSASSSQEVIAAGRIHPSAIYVAEIIGVGKANPSAGVGFSAQLLIAGGGGTTEVLCQKILWESPAPVSEENIIEFDESGANGVSVNNLSTSALYDFYVTLHQRV